MNKLKVMLLGLGATASLALADGAAMAKTVDDTVKANTEALWAVGGTIIVLSAITLIIRKISAQANRG